MSLFTLAYYATKESWYRYKEATNELSKDNDYGRADGKSVTTLFGHDRQNELGRSSSLNVGIIGPFIERLYRYHHRIEYISRFELVVLEYTIFKTYLSGTVYNV